MQRSARVGSDCWLGKGPLGREKIQQRLRRAAEFQVVSLEALVRRKLASWRFEDRRPLVDVIQAGQLGTAWPALRPPLLAERLQHMLDDPNGGWGRLVLI